MTSSTLYRFGRAFALAAFAVLLTSGSLFAQTGRVEGTVRSAGTGDPIANARVVVDGTALVATSNESGYYAIANVPTGTHTIRVQVIGYQTIVMTGQRVQPGVPTAVNFDLNPSVLRIEGVVVTGVVEGTSGVKLPFTVDQVTSEDLPVQPTGTPEEAIRGKVAGAKVVRTNGQPGGGVSVLLRGATSIDVQGRSQEPLYVVDGVILGASMVDIDALDIASIEVLKGAAASSLYGARAANGVVSIRTNRGRNLQQNQTRLVARTEIGRNYLGRSVDRTRHHEFFVDESGNCQVPVSPLPGETQTKRGTCWLDGPVGTGAAVSRANRVLDDPLGVGGFQDNAYGGQLFDHLNEFFDPGGFNTQSLTISHRAGSTNFSTAFSRTEEQGIILGLDGYQRKSVRLNLDHSLAENLELSGSGYYSNSNADDPTGNGINPFFGLMFLEADNDLFQPNADGEPFIIQPDPNALEENPLYYTHNAQIEDRRSRVLGNFRLRWYPDVIEGFDVEADFAFDRSDRGRFEFYKKGFKTIDNAQLPLGVVERTNSFDQAINASATARYLRQFGDLASTTSVRALLERSEFESFFAHAENLAVSGVNDLDVGDDTQDQISSTSQDVRSFGYFISQAFDLKDRYIVNGVLRRDGSSLFGVEERWATYYRVGAAYRLAEEDFWPIDFVDEFKLRYSRGTAGGRPNFSAQYETFSVQAGNVSKATLGNVDLKPEFATENEYGVDIILGGRVQASLTYAQSTVQDQILLVPLAGFFGFANQWQNAGTLQSKTWEASVQASIISTQNISWDWNIIWDRTRQRITEFSPPPFRFGSVFYNREGEEFGTMYGRRWMTDCSQLSGSCDGWQLNDDGYLVPVGTGANFTDGFTTNCVDSTGAPVTCWGSNVEFVDDPTTPDVETDPTAPATFNWGIPVSQDSFFLDENGTERSTDFLRMGLTTPDFNFGVSQTFRWKNLSLYTLFDAQIGGDVYNGTKQWSYRDLRHGDTDQFGKDETLKKPGDYYRALYATNNSSSAFVEDATFLKFRELSFRYSFNQSQMSSVFGGFMDRVSLSLVGRNLVTWTDYTGFDPEVGQNGANAAIERRDQFNYPNYRTFTGAIEIEF